MATETPMTIAYQLQLNNGVTPTGNAKHVNLSLGRMSLVGFQTQKAADLSLLLQSILAKDTEGEYITRKYSVAG